MTMDYGTDWPPAPEPMEHTGRHRKQRRRPKARTFRETMRSALGVLIGGAVIVTIVIAWDLVQAHGGATGLPLLPCGLTVH